MIMAWSLIKIVGVGVLEAVPCDSISLYEYRKIHQTEIIKWSRWGLLCGWGIKRLEMMSTARGRSKRQSRGRWAVQDPLLLLSSPCTTGFCRGQKQCSSQSHSPSISPECRLLSHLAKWLGKNQSRVEEKLPSSLIPWFHTLIIFNTTWQLFVFSLNPF